MKTVQLPRRYSQKKESTRLPDAGFSMTDIYEAAEEISCERKRVQPRIMAARAYIWAKGPIFFVNPVSFSITRRMK